MRHTLLAHPAATPPAALRIEAEIARRGGEVSLCFAAIGDTDAVRFAPSAESARADDLWRTTCFEAFLQAAGEDAYVELNLAPSRRWAAWRFESYRSGGAPADVTPRIDIKPSNGRFDLAAAIDLSPLLAQSAVWRVGLTAVVEAADEAMSYFALAHPSGKPDFHDSRGFILEVPA